MKSVAVVLIALAIFAISARAESSGSKSVSKRIMNGIAVTAHSYPWLLSLRIYGQHGCGAALIAPNYAVTAKHCIYQDASSYSVRCGAHDIMKDEDTTQTVQVEAIFKHENYSGGGRPSYPNDIALLRLAKNATLNKYCQVAKLPERGRDYGNVRGSIVGWGYYNDSDVKSNKPLKGPVTILTPEECHQREGNVIGSDVHICTLDKRSNGTYGSCLYDSGSPAQTDDNTVVGVLSFIFHGCNPARPSVYARLSNYLDWIEDKMSQEKA